MTVCCCDPLPGTCVSGYRPAKGDTYGVWGAIIAEANPCKGKWLELTKAMSDIELTAGRLQRMMVAKGVKSLRSVLFQETVCMLCISQ